MSAIVQTMRKTQRTSLYLERLGPFFVGRVFWQSEGGGTPAGACVLLRAVRFRRAWGRDCAARMRRCGVEPLARHVGGRRKRRRPTMVRRLFVRIRQPNERGVTPRLSKNDNPTGSPWSVPSAR